MNDFINKIIGDKKEWKAMEARANALPKDYQVVYDEMKQYIWKRSPETASMDILEGLLNLFEKGVAAGKSVLEITGKNVAAFCDEFLPDEKTYVDTWRETLNNTVAKKLGK